MLASGLANVPWALGWFGVLGLPKCLFGRFCFAAFPPHLTGKNAYEWFRALLYGEWELLIMYVP